MNLLRSFGTAKRHVLAVTALALAAACVAFAGGAATSNAATSNGVVVTSWSVLNDPGNGDILGQPSPGGNVGYDITVSNQGTSTANHVVLTESIGTGGQVALIARATGIACSGTTTLTCQLKQLPSGGTFRVIVLFRTPGLPASPTLTNTIVGSFDPQTTGPPNKRQTDTFGPCQDGFETGATCSTSNGVDAVTRQYAGLNTDGTTKKSFSESLALAKDALTVQGDVGQTGSVTLPDAFVNTNPDLGAANQYVGTTLETLQGTPGCATCLPYQTDVSMPLASTFTTAGPFWDGSTPKAFSVKITIPTAVLPSNFKPTGLWHAANSLATPQQVQNCTYDTAGVAQPQLTGGLCVSTLVLDKKKKVLDGEVWALTNGSYWIG